VRSEEVITVTPVVAVLTTTVCPLDGVYRVETLTTRPNTLAGVPHYVGHPATKAIVEAMGAVKAPSNLFGGLAVGETALVVSIKQGRSTRAQTGVTVDQEVTLDDLDFRALTRIE